MRFVFIVFLLVMTSACAKTPEDPNSLANFFPEAPDLTLPDASIGNSNPRYPWAKTYGNSAKGFFSIVGTSSIAIPTGQTFFGFAATEEDTLLAIKRTDSLNLSWVDLFSITIAASNSAVGQISLQCSIRFDGLFSSGFSYDQNAVFFTSTTWPYSLRKFNATTCAEASPIPIPATPSPWISRSKFQVSEGSLLGVYEISSTEYVRAYDPLTGQMTSLSSNYKWNDYTINFAAGFSRTASGIWGLNSCGNSQSCLYFVNSAGARFGYLPDADFPDLSRRGQSLTFILSSANDNITYLCVASGARVRLYRLDTESF